jgi:hypothetical protein
MRHLKPAALEQEAKYLRMLVYGEPGSGKTWLGASAALDELTSPVLYVEHRAQIASLRSNTEFVRAMENGRLVVLSLDKYEELNYVYTYLFQHAGRAPESPVHTEGIGSLFLEYGPPKTLIVDSLTELQRTEVLRVAGNPVDKFLTDISPPQIQNWGSLLNQFTLLANKFYALPMHVVFLGLEDVDYAPRIVGEAPKVTGFRLALQGSAQRQFPAYALTVMRLERAPRNSQAHAVGHTKAIRAKTKEQSGKIPAKVVGPTIPMLAEMLRQ